MVLESTVMNWQGWLAGRAFGGLGIGCMRKLIPRPLRLSENIRTNLSTEAFVPIYVAETAPVALRGAVMLSYLFWFVFGQLVGNVALQRVSQTSPLEYKIPIFSQWGMIGLMFILYIFLPETPAWCVKTGRMDMARRMTRRLYRGVKNFDEERYLHIIRLTLDHEKAEAERTGSLKWYAPLLGINRVSRGL